MPTDPCSYDGCDQPATTTRTVTAPGADPLAVPLCARHLAEVEPEGGQPDPRGPSDQ